MDAAAHPGSHGCAPGNGGGIFESRGDPGATSGLGAKSGFKTGHRGDHRLWRGKTGLWGPLRSGIARAPSVTAFRAGHGKTGQRGDYRLGVAPTPLQKHPRRYLPCLPRAVPPPVPANLIAKLIELGLARGRNAMAIWQDLVSETGFTSGYQSVRRFVGKLRGVQIPQAHPVIDTAPGEEAQVDYGTGPMVRDPRAASTAVPACSC